MPDAKIKVTFPDGRTLELEGSEEFVAKQAAEFKEAITGAITAPATTPATSPTPTAQSDAGSVQQAGVQQAGDNPYPNALTIKDGKVHITAEIPGNSNQEKMLNVALLHLLGASMLKATDVSIEEIRQACSAHGCLDSSNFTRALKARPQWILLSGKRGSQTAGLTNPGKKTAEALARQLNGSADSA